MKPTSVLVAGAGLFMGAGAWALHQQTSYIIASWRCGTAAGNLWIVSAAALFVLAASIWLSWGALRALVIDSSPNTVFRRPRRFLAVVGLLAALLFLFAIFLQASAALFLPGCAA
jgi:hypothetical protein